MKYKERQKVYLESIINKTDPVLGPRNVHIDVNNLCQLNCVTCWNYSPDLTDKKTKSWKNKYIIKELVFRLLKDLNELQTERIILSGGGEIFFHPEIMDIIREVKRLGFKLTLISNVLAMTEEQAHELVELKVDTILANVSSGNAGTYVDYHPNQDIDSYDKLLKLFDILRDLRDLKFVQVINGVNCHNIMDMLRLAAKYDVKTQFKLA
ncbi:MAG: radical SAM protein, partial [Patescibacteria group bacterium]|nr:radical SAM protein [Patescibacteria group bacterium]